MNDPLHGDWDEAQRLCELTDEEVRMARELGFEPAALVATHSASPGKTRVGDWVRSLYHRNSRPATPVPAVIEFRNPEHPWPDRPEIPEYVPNPADSMIEESDEESDWENDSFEDIPEEDIDDENATMQRRQRLFRWAAHAIAIAMSKLPEVKKVAAFGAVARPLTMEIPRFREFRQRRIKILHECGDLDLAVWTTDLSNLRELKKAMGRGLATVQNTRDGGVAHHQVDVHIFDAASGQYAGGLCEYGECPKPRKMDCLVPDCGKQPFLQQFRDYRFSQSRFARETVVTLFDRASGFLVRPPRIAAP